MKFLSQLTKIINTGQSRSVIITGNIYDLFYDGAQWVPLMQLLQSKCKVERKNGQKGITQICWQVNRPIEVIDDKHLDELDRCWVQFHKDTKALKARLGETLDNSVYALELLRQITECSRRGNAPNNLLIIIEAADMLLPDAPISHMMLHDRKRVSIVQDWFGDPSFVGGHDTVLLFAESRSAIHQRIGRLPQVLSIEVPLPDLEMRRQFVLDYAKTTNQLHDPYWSGNKLAENTSGLSLHAVLQLLRSGDYSPGNMIAKVEQYMEGQLGDGVVEFKRPTHTLADVIGLRRVKDFIKEELIPGFKSGAIGGALVGGPIGGGKSFTCEAVASEVDCPVILLKNIRSKWYGETDQIFERLRRLLETFHKIMIFVDEADAMFGDISSDQETERRLTGQIQQMMSDPAIRGRVIWFLMTARVHRLSPDIRRPGRMDLIIPILDPDGEDRDAFIKWTFGELQPEDRDEIRALMAGSSSARYAMLRSRIKTKGCKSVDEIKAVLFDMIEPDIGDTRRYQTLQAMVNCTRRSLLVDPDVKPDDFDAMRKGWHNEIIELEKRGVR